MSLIKVPSPALRKLISTTDISLSQWDERCYSLGKGGVAARLHYQSLADDTLIDWHDVGVKVSINRVSRHSLYFETDHCLPPTASYQLYLHSVGRVDGYVRLDPDSSNKKHPARYQYQFVLDHWLNEQQVAGMAGLD